MRLRSLMLAAALGAGLSACGNEKSAEAPKENETQMAVNGTGVAPGVDVEGIPEGLTADTFKTKCDADIVSIKAKFAALEGYKGPVSMETVLVPMNEMSVELGNAFSISSVMANSSPDEALRTAAEACEQELSKLATDISLSRPLYDLLSAVDVASADSATKFAHLKSVRNFRRSGVDKDDATRDKIRALSEEITKLGQDFGRNIREDVREIVLDSVADLKGLPEDYVAAHPPGEDGKIRITTDYPDYVPFMTYAENDAARKALRIASRSRAYPANEAILKSLITKRHEYAQLLGYATYADYVMEDKMVGSPVRAAAFINDIADTVRSAGERDKAILLDRLKKIDPSASEVGVWQYSYLQELVRQEAYQVDSRAIRAYFPFSKVKQGIFDLTSDLFGVTIRPWQTSVWAPGISAHEIWEGDRLIGRFYLDLHPRDGKYKHAAHFTVQDGIEGKQIPISALMCNFPGGDDPNALMEHDDVVTFLHEFGHLLHAMFGGHGAWSINAGVATEWDFVEAPSQLLEEWAYNYDTLKRFATNEAGEAIPESLVKQLNAARFFGRGLDTGTQTFYAALSIEYYRRDPASFELLPLMVALENQYSPFPYMEDTYFYANFGHLDGYSAQYYTYQWSLAISHDLFSRFAKEGMRNQDVSLAYRKAILDPGGSAPADELIRTFLGRDWTVDAYKDYLTSTE